MVVDDEGVRVVEGAVAMRMTVRLGALPAFVGVLVVLVVHMQVGVLEAFMVMPQHLGVVGRPERSRKEDGDGGRNRHQGEAVGDADGHAEPAGERIGDEPAGVGEGELCRKERRTIGAAGCRPVS